MSAERTTPRYFRLLALAVASALAACAGDPQSAPTPRPVSSASTAPVAATPVVTAPTPPAPTPAPGRPAAPAGTTVELAELRAELDPRRLMGASGADLNRLFGEPRLKRKDFPAEVWQYATNDCVMQLFLYEGPDRRGYRVRHVEVRSRDRVTRPERECFASVLDGTARSRG